MGELTAPIPGWYPSPNTAGLLRWWDGSRWTRWVEPVPGPGDVVIGPGTRPDGVQLVPAGHDLVSLYPPITDPRYAHSPLAAAMVDAVDVGVEPGRDVLMPAEYVAGVEAAHQLKERGGATGAMAGAAEQFQADQLAQSSGVRGQGRARAGGGSPTGSALSLAVNVAMAAGFVGVGVIGLGVVALTLWGGAPAGQMLAVAVVPLVFAVIGVGMLVGGLRRYLSDRNAPPPTAPPGAASPVRVAARPRLDEGDGHPAVPAQPMLFGTAQGRGFGRDRPVTWNDARPVRHGGIWFAGVCAVILAILIPTIASGLAPDSLAPGMATARGTMVRDDAGRSCSTRAEFVVDGRRYQATTGTARGACEFVGDHVTVVYTAATPGDGVARVRSPRTIALGPWVFALLCAAGVVVGIRLEVRSRRSLRAGPFTRS